MSGLVWKRDPDDRWSLVEAPRSLEMPLAELVGANADMVHVDGRHIVFGRVVWYLPIGYDTTAGLLHLTIDRDERPHV